MTVIEQAAIYDICSNVLGKWIFLGFTYGSGITVIVKYEGEPHGTKVITALQNCENDDKATLLMSHC